MEDLAHVREVTTWNSGGGIEIDIIQLANGKMLGISDESVVLYESMEDLESGQLRPRPMIEL